MLRGRPFHACALLATSPPQSQIPLSPLLPLHTRISPVTPFFPLDTKTAEVPLAQAPVARHKWVVNFFPLSPLSFALTGKRGEGVGYYTVTSGIMRRRRVDIFHRHSPSLPSSGFATPGLLCLCALYREGFSSVGAACLRSQGLRRLPLKRRGMARTLGAQESKPGEREDSVSVGRVKIVIAEDHGLGGRGV